MKTKPPSARAILRILAAMEKHYRTPPAGVTYYSEKADYYQGKADAMIEAMMVVKGRIR